MEILLADSLSGLTGQSLEINKCDSRCLADKLYDSGVLRRTGGVRSQCIDLLVKKGSAESRNAHAGV